MIYVSLHMPPCISKRTKALATFNSLVLRKDVSTSNNSPKCEMNAMRVSLVQNFTGILGIRIQIGIFSILSFLGSKNGFHHLSRRGVEWICQIFCIAQEVTSLSKKISENHSLTREWTLSKVFRWFPHSYLTHSLRLFLLNHQLLALSTMECFAICMTWWISTSSPKNIVFPFFPLTTGWGFLFSPPFGWWGRGFEEGGIWRELVPRSIS